MFCPNCGKNLPNDARFCDSCGGSLTPATASPVAPAAPAAPAAATPQGTYNPQNNAYQTQAAPQYSPFNMHNEHTRPLTTGNYLCMHLLMLIPIANIVLLFVWAFDSSTNLNKKNWARASLIWIAIGIGISILITSLTAATFGSFIRNLNGSF